MERTSRRGRMLGAMLMVFGAITLITAGTAGADPVYDEEEYDLHLKEAHHGAVFDDFVEEDCSEEALEDTESYAWHFIIKEATAAPGDPSSDNPDIASVTATFTGDGEVTGGHVVQNGKGWYLYTSGADTLEDAVGTTDPALEDGPYELVLSHTCAPEEEEEEEASLTIVKEVTGEVPTDWSVDFTGDAGSFTLGATEGDTEGPQTVAPGTYVVNETLEDDFDLTSIVCVGATSFTPDTGTGSVSVELADGDDATCTFTNDYPEVEGEVVTRTPTEPAAPAPAAQPTQVESLAFTGSGTERLAVAGVALVLLGSVLVLGDRRRKAEVEA